MSALPRPPLHDRKQWLAFGTLALLLLGVVPVLNLGLAPDAALHLGDPLIPWLGKLACYALLAIALDLLWGYTGILSLGHAAFFALGGYAMGMYLTRSAGSAGLHPSALPDFMVSLGWKELPWYWRGFDDLSFALGMALFVPGLLALGFGFFAFRSRIRGVSFAILTQVLSHALMLLMIRDEAGFGGSDGLTDWKRIASAPLETRETKLSLYVASVLALLGSYVLCRFVVQGRLGRVLLAIRDRESRVAFSGYDPRSFKLFVWTLSAMLCGLAGALYVPQVGIVHPGSLLPAHSIEIAVWVALGGRGTLSGAAFGAVLVHVTKSWLTASFPDAWPFVLGVLSIVVALLLPRGLAGALGQLAALLRRARARAAARADTPEVRGA
jgi:urea transport system permease protein